LIRALIFDFDGLILDTEGPIYRSWTEVYEAHGVALPFELWVKTVGSSNQAFHPQHQCRRLGRLHVAAARPLEAQRLAMGRDLRADDVVPVRDELDRRETVPRLPPREARPAGRLTYAKFA